MAIVKISGENRTLTDRQSVGEYLMTCGVRYEVWMPDMRGRRVLRQKTSSKPMQRKLKNLKRWVATLLPM